MTLYLLNFKNYFNREIEVCGNHAEDYTRPYGYINVINNMSLWNPNDGVNTVVTTCWNVNTIPNYVLVCPDNSDEIQSRWWVVKHERIAGTQYRLYLRRDLIADNIDLVLNNEHSYITRGWCETLSEEIYNTETIKFNQIKKGNYPLYDSTYCPWIVIYLKLPGTYDPSETNGETNIRTTQINWAAQAGIYQWTYKEGTPIEQYEVYWADYNTGYAGALKTPTTTPYTILTIPYSKHTYTTINGKSYTISKEDALNYARKFEVMLGEWIMDMQIVPFCPLSTQSVDTNYKPVIDASMLKAGYVDITVTDVSGNVNKCALYQADMSSTSDISLYWFKDSSTKPTMASVYVSDIKKQYLTEKYRLVSPNGSAAFDFNPAEMLYGSGQVLFKADFTYQPYNCYINVKPRFGRLYGGNYKDYRGLNASGDYSIPQTSDAWINYTQSNKNYAASFNREVLSLATSQTTEIVTEASNTLGSMISGGTQGNYLGGTAGMIGGTVGSLVSGIGTTVANEYLRNDEMEATIQQHNWQLQNIQASPTTISNVNTFNIDNVFVPVLEYYSASTSELINYNNYINENGYNISRYGALKAYLPNNITWFCSLMLDRVGYTTTDDDGVTTYHTFVGDSEMLSQLVQECSQGFYYKYNKVGG